MSAYRMALGAAVLTLLGIGMAGTAGGIVVAALLLLAWVAWLCVMEDATGRSRFLGAGVVSVALMGLGTGTALAAPSPPDASTCDVTQSLCIDPSGVLDILKNGKNDVLLGMGTAGIIAAVWGLRHGVTGKGWGAAVPAVVGGLLVSGLCANIAAGGVQKMLTGT